MSCNYLESNYYPGTWIQARLVLVLRVVAHPAAESLPMVALMSRPVALVSMPLVVVAAVVVVSFGVAQSPSAAFQLAEP